jgi:hypothetical protein
MLLSSLELEEEKNVEIYRRGNKIAGWTNAITAALTMIKLSEVDSLEI